MSYPKQQPVRKSVGKKELKERARQAKAKDRMTNKKYNPSWG